MTAPNQGVQPDTSERSVQDRLVEAAEELFCRRGYNETSVRDIAAIAGCNVASVNYYFGGKDNLYVEVWRRRLAFMRTHRLASIEKVMSAPNPPQLENLLHSYAVSFIEPLVEGGPHCRFINLMAREMIDPHLPRDMYVEEMVTPVLEAFREALLKICPWLDAGTVPMVVFSIVGQLLMHTVCVKEMFEGSTHPELSRIDLDSIVNHVVKFSAAGVRGCTEVQRG
ncbi:MAG: TetR/AcrR family transcriptional regulator [Planctomycetes bacterium]|jgi:AcrR family transcriptional regulator|nr:TetR/AcrR family transcriptional regulator [Planctomycetota bacterium]